MTDVERNRADPPLPGEPIDPADLPHVPPLRGATRTAYRFVVLAAVVYALFVLNPANRGNLGAYLVLLCAEVLLLLNILGMGWTISARSDANPNEQPAVGEARRSLVAGDWAPTIDVLIPVYGEPLEVIAHTVQAARDMRLPHRTVVCDDGGSDQVAALARSLGVDYVAREETEGAKAGNLNNAMRFTDGELIAVFDADFAPHPEFLTVMVPYFVNDNLAFAQSPQTYRNAHESPAADAAASNQRVFYEVVCPGKNAFNAQFHVGTNAVLRRVAIEEIGGYPSHSRSEDIWASLEMHRRGWASVYVPDQLAAGLAPTTVFGHLRQQLRWATGSFEVGVHGKPWRRSGDLTIDQRIQYLLAPLHYLQSVATLVFLLLPALFILFGVQPISAPGSTWLLWYLPLFLLTQLALLLQVGTWRPFWIALSVASAPVHLRALARVVTGRSGRAEWFVTNRVIRQPMIVEFMPVQVVAFCLNLAAIVVGLVVLDKPLNSIVALGLCALQVVMFGAVFAVAVRDRHREPAGFGSTPPLPADLREMVGEGQ